MRIITHAWASRTGRYRQNWDQDIYTIENDPHAAAGTMNGSRIFSVTPGARVATDRSGGSLRIVNITGAEKEFTLDYRGRRHTVRLQPDAAFAP